MKPRDLLDDSRIVLDIEGKSPKSAIISRLVALALGEDSPHLAAVTEDLLAREAKMTTGIGQGVAIPHTRSALVESPAAALGVCAEGVDFGAVDGEPVHIIFIFITPEKDPALHIETLSAAAEEFGDARLRKSLTKAGSAADVMALLTSGAG